MSADIRPYNIDLISNPSALIYANCLNRLLAFLIDVIFLGLSGSALVALILGIYGNSWLVIMLLFLLLPLGTLLYFPLMESSSWQATLGKWFCGLQVVNCAGQRISFLHALGRGILTIFLLSVLNVFAYLTLLLSDKKQALYDMLSDCVVVKGAGPGKLQPVVWVLLQGMFLGVVLTVFIYAGEIRAYLDRWGVTETSSGEAPARDIRLIPSKPRGRA